MTVLPNKKRSKQPTNFRWWDSPSVPPFKTPVPQAFHPPPQQQACVIIVFYHQYCASGSLVHSHKNLLCPTSVTLPSWKRCPSRFDMSELVVGLTESS